MANLRVLDATTASKYVKMGGDGTDVDPFIPEHLETNSADILTAAQAIQAAAVAIQAAVEILDNIVAGSEAQVDILSIAAGENLIGMVGSPDDVISVEPVNAAEAHIVGDLLFDSTEIPNAVRANGGTCVLQSVAIRDLGKQNKGMTLVFSDTEVDFGTLGSTLILTDENLVKTLGHVTIIDADYVNLGPNGIGTKSCIGLELKAAAASTSLWVAGITTSTPTPASVGDYKILFGLLKS